MPPDHKDHKDRKDYSGRISLNGHSPAPQSGAPLLTTIQQHIRTQGPMTLAAFMQHCLLDPRHGYYTTGAPFGAAGDFITAPEISQMFGEVLGLTLAQHWIHLGSPPRIRLIELGPGRGTLMADICRVAASVPGFQAAIAVHFVEASPRLRAEQHSRVPNAHWHDRLEDVPDGPCLIIANEFFDALPIHQFVKTGDSWAEVGVTLDTSQDGAPETAPLCYTKLPPGPSFAAIRKLAEGMPQGSVVEISPASLAVAHQIADRITGRRESSGEGAGGGAAILIDYGYSAPTGDPTFQALEAHRTVDPLARPGCADLTAHVDFGALSSVFEAAGLSPAPITGQGDYLMARGIGARAQKLSQKLSQARLQTLNPTYEDSAAILAALKRLVDPDEMGTLFKVLEVPPHAGI